MDGFGGATTFCGRVFGFWPPVVALEILQPGPLFIVHKLELGSVWLPKIACKRKEGRDQWRTPSSLLAVRNRSVIQGAKRKGNCSEVLGESS